MNITILQLEVRLIYDIETQWNWTSDN